MTAKKINKEFLLTDNTVNVYGFRLLTEGFLLDRYKANPIGYRQHKREDGIVLRWEDFRIDGDRVYAKPVINLSNPLGKQTAEEVENGFLNAASVGGIVVVEHSKDPALMLEGQTGPTITKWYSKEISLVDVPGNPNATAIQLFDASERAINLTDFIQDTLKDLRGNTFFNHSNKKNNSMSLKNLLIATLALGGLSLADDTSDETLADKVKDLMGKAGQVPELEKKLSDTQQALDKAKSDLQEQKTAQDLTQVKSLTDEAIKAGKLTVKLAQELSDKYSDDPAGLKNLIDAMPAYQPVTKQIEGAQASAKNLADLSWSELDKQGKLSELKQIDFEGFKAKYKEQFGVDYKG